MLVWFVYLTNNRKSYRNAALTQEEVEAQPYLIMEVISGGAKRVLFIDEEPGSSKIRRHYEQIPIVFVYCFCHTQSQRDIVSLLFRPCQVALLEVPKHVFNDENHWSLLPLEASAAASHVRNMHLESVDEKMLLMALGDRVDAVLMTSPETLLDTFTAQLPRRYDSSGAKQKAQRGLYGFLERHIQQWCQRYVETDKELAIIVGGCEAAALLECLKRKTSNVRALPMKNAIHVKLPGDPQIYIVKLIVLETAHFDGLSTLLMAGTHDEHVVIGCGVRKLFNGEFFNGFVSTIGAFENGEKLIYGIVYEDGDTEDYFVGEVIGTSSVRCMGSRQSHNWPHKRFITPRSERPNFCQIRLIDERPQVATQGKTIPNRNQILEKRC